jgi:hypothetical protein
MKYFVRDEQGNNIAELSQETIRMLLETQSLYRSKKTLDSIIQDICQVYIEIFSSAEKWDTLPIIQGNLHKVLVKSSRLGLMVIKAINELSEEDHDEIDLDA